MFLSAGVAEWFKAPAWKAGSFTGARVRISSPALMLPVQTELKVLANPEKAKILQRFFKTGKGEYGEGDIFLGIMVGDSRKVAKKHASISFPELKKLLASKIHEERLVALLILVQKFSKGSEAEKKGVFDFFLENTVHINNWDLVDLSADKIVGEFLFDKPKAVLRKLAKSSNLWERRIAILSTFAFIKRNSFDQTLKVSKMLLSDEHDLIHKAVGWMLREVGKRDLAVEENFLKKHYKAMPRTMLRYAIEKFDEKKRKAYLNGLV